jgi:nucleotidyltransferase/DNA polymerase involved in DNA repair
MKQQDSHKATGTASNGTRPIHASNDTQAHKDPSSSTDKEKDAFSRMKYRPETSKEIQSFDQLEASDELAMEGPVMKDFGDYMTLKRSKIKRQYMMAEQLASQENKVSSKLFSGLTAFISTSIYLERSEHLNTQRQNTGVDFKYLARLWILHGGVLTQNVNSGQITHFVNSFLPIYFLRDLDKMRSKMRLVSPQWILDCVEQDKRLPTFPYDLHVVDAEGVAYNKQLKLSFASGNKKSASSSTIQTSTQLMITSSPAASMSHSHATLVGANAEEDATDVQNEDDDYDEWSGGQRMRTSAENPNFVADYFASSRLHHLASWKMKFQEELELHLMSIAKSDNPVPPSSKSKNSKSQSHNLVSSLLPSSNESELEDELEMVDEPMIVHIDMDAFFASVATRHKPELKDKPVAISHGGNRALCASVNYAARAVGIHNGTRLLDAQQRCKDAGLELTVLGYDFPAYEQVSRLAHEIFLRHTPQLHIKSCDEAILDFTGVLNTLAQVKATVSQIRLEVFQATGCTCSAGIGSTLTLARFALKKAKPNGMAVAPSWRNFALPSGLESPVSRAVPRLMMSFRSGEISQDNYQTSIVELMHNVGNSTDQQEQNTDMTGEDGDAGGISTQSDSSKSPLTFLSRWSLSDLPGVGWKTRPKFGPSVKFVADVQRMSLLELRSILGHKNGTSLYLACRGIDAKPLAPFSISNRLGDRKSISVDLSYGVRFHNYQQVSKFIVDVSEELSRRCQKANLVGKTATVKLWIRLPGTPPTSFLGHGPCSTASKSFPFHTPTADAAILASTAEKLVTSFGLDVQELRGFGLALSQLSKPTTSSSRSHSITKMFKAAVEANALKQDVIIEEVPTDRGSTKKRLRTIDALMEKTLNKAKKKSKRTETTSNSLHGAQTKTKSPEADTKETGTLSPPQVLVFQTTEPSSSSSRIIGYTKVDDEIVRKLDVWMSLVEVPGPIHKELVFQFASTLVASRNLEDMETLAKKLIRAANLKGSWLPMVADVVELIQKGVKESYGFDLYLPLLPTVASQLPQGHKHDAP